MTIWNIRDRDGNERYLREDKKKTNFCDCQCHRIFDKVIACADCNCHKSRDGKK